MTKEKQLAKQLKTLYQTRTPEAFKNAFQALYHSEEFKILLNDSYFKMFFEFRDAMFEYSEDMPKILIEFYEEKDKQEELKALKTIIEAINETFGNVEVSYWLYLGATEPETAKTDCYFEFFDNFQYDIEFEEFEYDEEGKSWGAVQKYFNLN